MTKTRTSSLVLVLAGAWPAVGCGDRAPPPNWPDPPPPTLAEPIGGETQAPERAKEPADPAPEPAAAAETDTDGAAPAQTTGETAPESAASKETVE